MRVLEHKSAAYSPRTYANAARAHLTVAFATDFSTAGEKCTHRAAGLKYVAIDLPRDVVMSAREVWKACRKHGQDTTPIVLNIAGNGIYTLTKTGWTQQAINKHVYDVLALVCKHWPVGMIVTGGQTGVDLAGGVAAEMLGIPCEMTLPKGYIQRGVDGIDVSRTEQDILTQVAYYKGVLSRDIYGDDVPQ